MTAVRRDAEQRHFDAFRLRAAEFGCWAWPMFDGDPVARSSSGLGVPVWRWIVLVLGSPKLDIFLMGCIFRLIKMSHR